MSQKRRKSTIFNRNMQIYFFLLAYIKDISIFAADLRKNIFNFLQKGLACIFF